MVLSHHCVSLLLVALWTTSTLSAADLLPMTRQQEAISLLKTRGQDLRLMELGGEVRCTLELEQPTLEEIAATVHLPQLTELTIHRGHITRRWIEHLRKLSQLEKITLEYCRFEQGNIAFLKHMTSLERLYLMHCRFEGASLSELNNLDKLYYTRISDCVLEDSGNLVFPHEMERLSRVYVYDTFVNRWSFRQMVKSPYLTALKFQDSKVTDEYLEDLEPGDALQRLRVYHNISDEAGNRFRDANPQVRFYW